MNVLSIGNSFSQDAQRYLRGIALADNVDLMTTNLYIGGCSLETHWNNVLTDEPAYSLETNGAPTGRMISVKDALAKENWDFVTLQQASHLSFDYRTYQPYLKNLSHFVKQYAPGARELIHQTWAYEQGSERLSAVAGYNDQLKMFRDIKAAYSRAAKDLGGLQIIPSGEAIQIALAKVIKNIYRDTFHMSLGIGRYIVGAVWYQILTGNSILGNNFAEFEEEIPEYDLKLARQCASEAVCSYS